MSTQHNITTNVGSRTAASVKATTAAATLISGSNNSGPSSQEAPLDPAIKYFHPPPGRFGVSGGSGAALGYLGAEVVDSGALAHGSGSTGSGARKSGGGSSHHKKKPHPALASLPDYHPSQGRTHSREPSYAHYGDDAHGHGHGNDNDNDFIYNQFHAGNSHQNTHVQSHVQSAPKVRETMNKTEETCAGESRGVRYFVDFNTLPLSFIIDYLNRNLIPATFGQAPTPTNILTNSVNSANPGMNPNGMPNMNPNIGMGVMQGQGIIQGEEGLGVGGGMQNGGGVETGGQGGGEGVGWNEDKKACDPKQIFAVPSTTGQPGQDTDLSPSQSYQPNRSNTANSNSNSNRTGGPGVGSGNATSSRRAGKKNLNRKQSGQADGEGTVGQGSGSGQQGQLGRRRHTNTSMTAAVIQESIMMAQQEEERRAKVEEEERKGSGEGGETVEVEEPAKMDLEEVTVALEPEQAEKVEHTDTLDAPAQPEVDEQAKEKDSAMAIDTEDAAPDVDAPTEEKRAIRGRATKKRKAGDGDDSADPEGGEDQDRARSGSRKSETSPKPSTNALRRSGRKPLPKGAPLATVHKQTRINYSPTPSITSSDSDYVPPGYQAILSDLDQASQVLRNRARDHWCETLKAGMMNPDEQRLKLANGGQVPTWNPTMLSMVDTGPAGGGGIGYGPGPGQVTGLPGMHGTRTGGLMKETDIVVDFLYTLKVGNRQLKVAHLPSLSGQHSAPM